METTTRDIATVYGLTFVDYVEHPYVGMMAGGIRVVAGDDFDKMMAFADKHEFERHVVDGILVLGRESREDRWRRQAEAFDPVAVVHDAFPMGVDGASVDDLFGAYAVDGVGLNLTAIDGAPVLDPRWPDRIRRGRIRQLVDGVRVFGIANATTFDHFVTACALEGHVFAAGERAPELFVRGIRMTPDNGDAVQRFWSMIDDVGGWLEEDRLGDWWFTA